MSKNDSLCAVKCVVQVCKKIYNANINKKRVFVLKKMYKMYKTMYRLEREEITWQRKLLVYYYV